MRFGLALAAMMLPGLAWADARWDAYQMLLWQDRTPVQMRGLAALGFTGAKLSATGGNVDAEGRALRQGAGLSYYLENLATDFYAPYHRYTIGKPVNWLLEAAKAQYRANPRDPDVFVREPGLLDPVWLERIRLRLDGVVRAEAANRPLFYNLGDESGIADLAVAWDFDMAPASLAGFRAWLRTGYPDLPALNAQWGSAFAAWDDVMPELTDAAVRRADGNFSAWSDFKAWMDVAFARAVQAGTDAVHGADRTALSALEGGQVPGWGGYDYALLAPAVDVMEIYDYGNSLDVAVAFNPALIPLRTSFGAGPREAHAVWRHLLHGGRGTVVWDEADDVVAADGSPGPRGREIAALMRAIQPVAALLRAAQPDPDAVAILVSQASFRVNWLLDRQKGDRDWAARDAEREYDDNAWRASRRVLVERLAELGVQPRFVSSGMLEGGRLRDGSVKVLILPHAIALSDAEVDAIRAFRAAGGTVLADTEPGLFDGHGRRRAAAPLTEVPHPAVVRLDGDGANPSTLAGLAALLRDAGVAPRVRLLGPDGQAATGVEARWFTHERGTVLALQTARPWGGPPVVVVQLPGQLPGRMTVSDARGGAAVTSDRAVVALDPIEPTVLMLSR